MYKAQNSPLDNSFSDISAVFQLETKNSFYKKCWAYMVSIQKIIIGKKYIEKTAIFTHFIML